ncbi:MAG: hypothetical protein H7255_10390 [Ramlibacter sp.]|nr:hypothetical protein [Ramlibacter sp.]
MAESQRAEQRRAREADGARELAAEQARGRELERQRLAADQLEKQERARKAAEERNQEAREKAQRLAAEDRGKREFRDAMIRGIRLAATKCPDGEGHYYATGLLPKPKPKGGYCIDVHYEASCPGSRNVVTGVATKFIGLNGCFGDTYKIDPKPACDVKAVAIRVTDVTLDCN